jgi:mRNA interferase RelE/StbE
MQYRIEFTPKARMEFDGLPRHVRRRIARWVELLADDPRRAGTKQLEGRPELRRVHASKDYVIVYTVRQREILVLIVRVAHRKDVYRRL